MIRVAIVADDLTGALDAASPFACRGARTICLTNPDAISVASVTNADVISVSTNSRHLPPYLAAETVRAAALKIRQLLPDIVLKKVDSRLKGNVAEECDAVASVFNLAQLLVVPAAPDIGRFVNQGAVVGAGVAQPIVVTQRLGLSSFPCDIRDVSTNVDMMHIAREYLGHKAVLPVCSRGFSVALAECLFPRIAALELPLGLPCLVAIGSRDPVTEIQQKVLGEAAGFVCVEAPDGAVPYNLTPKPRLLLRCSGPLLQSNEIVAQRFAEGIARVTEIMEPRVMLCSGGDTAFAVLNQFQQHCLQVIGEAAPGLPVCRTTLAKRDIIFISKSGGFGSRTTLLDIFANKKGDMRPEAHGLNGS